VITSAEQEGSASATASLVCGGCLQLVHSSPAGGRNVSLIVEDHNLRSDYVSVVSQRATFHFAQVLFPFHAADLGTSAVALRKWVL
jgi:hypothetical protein